MERLINIFFLFIAAQEIIDFIIVRTIAQKIKEEDSETYRDIGSPSTSIISRKVSFGLFLYVWGDKPTNVSKGLIQQWLFLRLVWVLRILEVIVIIIYNVYNYKI